MQLFNQLCVALHRWLSWLLYHFWFLLYLLPFVQNLGETILGCHELFSYLILFRVLLLDKFKHAETLGILIQVLTLTPLVLVPRVCLRGQLHGRPLLCELLSLDC